MAVNNDGKSIFKTQACWSNAGESLLCLYTGDWRSERPIVDKEKCNTCGFCVVYCPPQCMVDDEDKIHYKANLEFCKGCGVCAKECPKGAIIMTPEGEYANDCPNE